MSCTLSTGHFPAISDDLVNSYHLLLCCLDHLYSNALFTRNRRELLNPNFEGIFLNSNICFSNFGNHRYLKFTSIHFPFMQDSLRILETEISGCQLMCHVLLNDCVTGIKVQSSVITSLDSVFNLLTFTEFGGSMASLFLVSVLGLGKKKNFSVPLGQVALKFGLPSQAQFGLLIISLADNLSDPLLV